METPNKGLKAQTSTETVPTEKKTLTPAQEALKAAKKVKLVIKDNAKARIQNALPAIVAKVVDQQPDLFDKMFNKPFSECSSAQKQDWKSLILNALAPEIAD
jgi:hypothetical protein